MIDRFREHLRDKSGGSPKTTKRNLAQTHPESDSGQPHISGFEVLVDEHDEGLKASGYEENIMCRRLLATSQSNIARKQKMEEEMQAREPASPPPRRHHRPSVTTAPT